MTTTVSPTLLLSPLSSARSVLIVGASGRMGQAVVAALAKSPHHSQIKIHAFLRTPSKLGVPLQSACHSVTQGDARSPDDLFDAIQSSRPTHIIVCIGLPDSLKQTDIRESSAIALSSALRESGFHATVRICVVSAQGSGNSTIRYVVPLVGRVIQFVLRHQLRDHDCQEEVLSSAFDHDLHQSRLLIVRPMGLTNKQSKRCYGVMQLKHKQTSPTLVVHRIDLAEWICGRICGPQTLFGGTITITGVRRC